MAAADAVTRLTPGLPCNRDHVYSCDFQADVLWTRPNDRTRRENGRYIDDPVERRPQQTRRLCQYCRGHWEA